MDILARVYIPRMFDSVILENGYDALFTTIYHTDCNFAFGGKWKRKYSYSYGYTTAAKYFTCPNCGVHSEPFRNKILFVRDDESLIPLEVWADVVEFKNYLDLRFTYRAITMRYDGTFIDEGIRKETLRFDFKRKKATYTDYNRDKHELTLEYIHHKRVMEVLTYLGKSYAMHDINRKPLNNVFRSLRLAFERRIKKAYGYSTSDVYIAPSFNEDNGYHFSMLLNMILKLSAPDMPNVISIQRGADYWNDYYSRLITSIPFDSDVLDLTKKGMNFQEALRTVYKSPNSKALRRAMAKNPMSVVLSNVLSLFKDENCRRTIVDLNRHNLPDDEKYKYTGKVHCAKDIRKSMKLHVNGSKEFWQTIIAKYGEPSTLRWILSEDFRDIEDCVRMYSELIVKYRDMFWVKRFKLKSLHAELINVYNKQEYGDVNLPAIPALNADVNGLHFVVPKTAADLMIIGKQLKNCVGSYKDRVMKGNTAIVVVTDDSMKPVACLELTKDIDSKEKFTKLVQAKLFGNQCVSKNKDVNNTVLTWANQLKIEPVTVDIQAQVS